MLSRTFTRVARPLSTTLSLSTTTFRSATTLVVSDSDSSALSPSVNSVVTAASALGGGEIHVLITGSTVDSVASSAASIPGVTKVLTVDSPTYSKPIAEHMSAAVLSAHSSNAYTHIMAPASNGGKNWVPRVGAALDVSPLADVLEVHGENTFVRPMYAGNALAKVTTTDKVKVMTVRTTAFEKAASEGGSAPVEPLEISNPPAGNVPEFVSENVSQSDRPDLTAAGVVISGGRGMKNGENFAMLETLADKVGGAVGASRAAVDAGFVPNELQVGQTGKVVAPDLYVAVGISGAIQHLSGMKDSKTIVAINKDKEAPIFQVADYGLVADLFDAVPELTEKI